MLNFFSNLRDRKLEESKLKSNEGKELKPGVKVYAKVLKKNANRYLLNLNGDKILAKSERELVDGQIVRLKIERVTDKNELIVKIEDEESKAIPILDKTIDESLKIRREVLKLSVEEKIYLNSTEVDELVEGLEKFSKRGKEISADLIKALIVMKKHKVGSEDIFEGLRRYYSKKVEVKLELKKLLSGLMEEIKYLEEERDSFAKGLNRVNELNDKQGFLALLLGIKEFEKPISIQLKKEGP